MIRLEKGFIGLDVKLYYRFKRCPMSEQIINFASV